MLIFLLGCVSRLPQNGILRVVVGSKESSRILTNSSGRFDLRLSADVCGAGSEPREHPEVGKRCHCFASLIASRRVIVRCDTSNDGDNSQRKRRVALIFQWIYDFATDRKSYIVRQFRMS